MVYEISYISYVVGFLGIALAFLYIAGTRTKNEFIYWSAICVLAASGVGHFVVLVSLLTKWWVV